MPGLKPPLAKPTIQQTFAFWQVADEQPSPECSRSGRGRDTQASGFPKPTVLAAGFPESTALAAGSNATDVAEPATAATSQISDRQSLMANLRDRAAAISAGPAMNSLQQFSTGCSHLDTWLPGGGLKRGELCEWVGGHDACGASTLSMLAAAASMRETNDSTQNQSAQTDSSHSGPIIVVDPCETFHAAGAIACGIAPERIVVCRGGCRRDSVWAIDQALRCASVAVVWAALPWNLNDRDARRLQLAAEIGRTPGLFVLPATARKRPSFAAVRWHVSSVAVDATRLSADQRARAGLPLRPPLDLRVLRVSLDRARKLDRTSGQSQHTTYLAIAPDARLYALAPAAVAGLLKPIAPLPQPVAGLHSTLTSHHTPARIRHEAVAVPLAARLADPTSANVGHDANRRVG